MATSSAVSPALVAAARRLGVPRKDVTAAAAVLTDPDGPGMPWGEGEVLDALEDLVVLARGGSLVVPAETLRWVCALDEGEVPPGF